MIYINQLGIDWDKESPKVREAVENMIRAYNLHESFSADEEKRFDDLLLVAFPEEKKAEEVSKP